MKDLIKIEAIFVKDKNDVVKALRILDRIGVQVMTEEDREIYLLNEELVVQNDYMMREDNGFRIQSHYIGGGISLESLENQVDKIVEDYPDFCSKIKEIRDKEKEMNEEIKLLKVSIPAIHLK